MQEHFLQNIEIIDFKCFKNFKTKDFKRVNLISGKNNVGKTAFMEALYINIYSSNIEKMATALINITFMRNNLEFVFDNSNTSYKEKYLENINYYHVESNKNLTKFLLHSQNGIKKYIFEINENKVEININEFSYNSERVSNVKYIDNFGFSNGQLNSVFKIIQEKDSENILNNYIKMFDSNILNFKILGEEPSCKSSVSNKYQNINEFGDGLKHYISIICSLYTCENGYLFIDEIDNGIHYTQLEKLWEIIFTISKEVNCQVFATTHSKEMINAYEKVSKELRDEDICFIELGKNIENEIKANVYDQRMFLQELNLNHEIRGR